MEVYCDMDGVLANWIKAAADWLGVPPCDPDVDFARHLAEHSLSEADLWADIGHTAKFWLEIPQLPAAKELFRGLKKVGELRVLSSCGDRLSCIAEAKEKWLEQAGLSATLIPMKEKFLLANKDRLLIDDTESQCESWADAGGCAILFPGPSVPHADAVRWVLKEAAKLSAGDKVWQARVIRRAGVTGATTGQQQARGDLSLVDSGD